MGTFQRKKPPKYLMKRKNNAEKGRLCTSSKITELSLEPSILRIPPAPHVGNYILTYNIIPWSLPQRWKSNEGTNDLSYDSSRRQQGKSSILASSFKMTTSNPLNFPKFEKKTTCPRNHHFGKRREQPSSLQNSETDVLTNSWAKGRSTTLSGAANQQTATNRQHRGHRGERPKQGPRMT